MQVSHVRASWYLLQSACTQTHKQGGLHSAGGGCQGVTGETGVRLVILAAVGLQTNTVQRKGRPRGHTVVCLSSLRAMHRSRPPCNAESSLISCTCACKFDTCVCMHATPPPARVHVGHVPMCMQDLYLCVRCMQHIHPCAYRTWADCSGSHREVMGEPIPCQLQVTAQTRGLFRCRAR